MTSPLENKVALVTGGAHRLGGALSLGLARAGADVVVNYLSSEASAQVMLDQITTLGRRAIAIQADMGRVDQVQRLVTQTLATFGRLDILIHAASPFQRATFENVTEAIWDQAVDVTLKGGFFLAQAAAPALREGRGAIIFISDVAARRPFPSFIPHSIAKAGLETLTLALAQALAPEVRVNAIAPGIVWPPETWTEARIARSAAQTLVGHIGAPDDMVQTLLFLLTNPFITGQVITVDGGKRV